MENRPSDGLSGREHRVTGANRFRTFANRLRHCGMKRIEAAAVFALGLMALSGQAHAQSSTNSNNLTPNAPAAVTISPGGTEMMSVPTPATPSFTSDTSAFTSSGTSSLTSGTSPGSTAPAANPAGTSGTAAGSAAGGADPLNPDCAIAGSDDPANMSFDTIGCGQ